jgi:NAD-specific glutamate dehydrogenase
MAITARGAPETAPRKFREHGPDIQRATLTTVGTSKTAIKVGNSQVGPMMSEDGSAK